MNYANICRKESERLSKRCFTIEVYDESFYNKYMDRLELEIKTAEAYKNYEFIAYLQPKVNLKTGKIESAEALLRWIDKDGRFVPLNEFLPFLNENSYIQIVDLDIFDQLCKYLDERIKLNKKVVLISFNFSKTSFYSPNIQKEYTNIFEKYDIPKDLIDIEFMESISLDDTEHMKKTVAKFKDYGFQCSLDDFGNGYSSFNVLLNAQFDTVKMDRQFFLNNLKGDNKLVIHTVINLIHSLNMDVVAEGVELEEHVEFLKECGCDFVQGYYYYKPMSVSDFDLILEKENENEKAK